MHARPKLSIPRRIFLGFALVLTVSVTVSVASFVQHQRTAGALSLLHDGLLPLALAVSEARAAQGVFNTLLDRILFEHDTRATVAWFKEARVRRPAIMTRALAAVARVEALALASFQQPPVFRLRRELQRIQATLTKGDERYKALFESLDLKDKKAAELILKDLRGNERTVERHLAELWEQILRQIEATSAVAAEQERQSIGILAALIAISLVIGLVVTWWSHHMLSPLPKLQERVEAVARGELVQHLGPTTDDEIGRLAREFERMVAALAARDARLIQSERLASIGRMAAHVTHEVRSPLSSIGLNVELLEEEIPSDRAEAKALIAAIQREIESLNQITEEYLRLARLPNPRLEPESLGDLTRSTVQFLRPELKSAGIEVAVEIDSDLPQVAADEGQIRQVLKNLLKNAREAMPNGGPVSIRVQTRDAGVLIAIADSGVGMKPEQSQRVFDLFYTTKNYGSGLGLSLAQQIVLSHQGRISCQSQPGHGTTFEVWLPVLESPTPDHDHSADPVSQPDLSQS
jgi:two-component system NtrC family sensor kinase